MFILHFFIIYSFLKTHVMIFKELRKHQKLEAKRNPMYEKNKFGKFFIYFMAIFWYAYLILFGILFSSFFEKIFPNMEPYHIMNKGLIYILIVDFLIRFAFQKTPIQEIKPYLLLPVKKNKLFNFLLTRNIFSSFNIFWLFMLIPFSFLTLFKFYGVMGLIAYCFGFWLLALMNNYWYIICKTLISEKVIYILLPILVYGILIGSDFLFDYPISTFTMNLGEGFIEGNILYYLGVIVMIGILWLVNRRLMMNNLYAELSKVNDTKVKNVSEYKFLEKYGEVGEYFRLELKLLFRNKRSKAMFRSACLLIILLTAMLFTPTYEGIFGKSFVCVYNFAVLGIMMLTQLMSFEGNYLDGLMSRKESIYNLLRAKYYFYSIMTLVPFILMIPAIIMEKITWLMAFSYIFFTTGFIYLMLFQLAVYNNKTAPLNESMMGRQSTGTGFQNLISIGAFTLPVLTSSILQTALGETTGLLILMGLGIVLTLTANLWIKNVYRRFMKRRYKNMEGFRDTR